MLIFMTGYQYMVKNKFTHREESRTDRACLSKILAAVTWHLSKKVKVLGAGDHGLGSGLVHSHSWFSTSSLD